MAWGGGGGGEGGGGGVHGRSPGLPDYVQLFEIQYAMSDQFWR